MILETHRKRLEKDPNNPLFRFSLGQALFQEGQFEEAIEHLNFCVNSRADWMLPRILLGKALLQTNNEAEARPYLEQALELAISQDHRDPEAEVRALLADLK